MNNTCLRFFPAFLLSLSLGSSWAAGPVNTVNDGAVISGGTYYNTAAGKTTFVNTTGQAIWLKSGETVRGLQVDAGGNPTGHGGNILISAPKGMVRLDGNIDVNALQDGKGIFMGNGGKVTVNAQYLYQSGNIYANGINGGSVQLNVGALTVTPGAGIYAGGFGDAAGKGGRGGALSIKATSTVDLRTGSTLDVTGNSGLITLVGSVVNVDGIVRADGVLTTPAIQTTDGNGVPTSYTRASKVIDGNGNMAIVTANPGNGGKILLVATGKTATDAAVNAAIAEGENGPEAPLTSVEKDALLSEQSALQGQAGNIKLGSNAILSANGSDGLSYRISGFSNASYTGTRTSSDGTSMFDQDGNPLSFSASRLSSRAFVRASRPGNGGLISLKTSRDIDNAATITANGGRGGNVRGDLDVNYNSLSTRIRPLIITSPAFQGGKGGRIMMKAGNDLTLADSSSVQARGGSGGDGEVYARFHFPSYGSIIVASAGAGKGGNGGSVQYRWAHMSNSAPGSSTWVDGGHGGNAASISQDQLNQVSGVTLTDGNGYYVTLDSMAGYGMAGGNGGRIAFSGPRGTALGLHTGAWGGGLGGQAGSTPDGVASGLSVFLKMLSSYSLPSGGRYGINGLPGSEGRLGKATIPN